MMKKLLNLLLIVFVFSVKASFSENPKTPEFLKGDNLWVDSLMMTLSEDEKIAQLFMISVLSNKDDKYKKNIAEIISRYKIGGLMFLQGGPIRQAKLTNYFQSISKVPLMIALDAEFGLSMRLDSTVRFPWQMTLGAISDTNLIFQMGAEIARQCKMIGVISILLQL